MALTPENKNTTEHAIYKLHEERNAKQEQRGYLGWSQIGETCKRQLWYSFRMAKKPTIEGRIARLFDTGHREEERVISELRSIGCSVYSLDPSTGTQFGVSSHGGHFKGHLDCVALGLPEAPKTYHLVDVKTIKAKKFDQLLKDGMQKMYPKYWSQAHGYMGLQGLERAMFIFVCKDDDRIHCEQFTFDKAQFDKDMAKALDIINSAEPPDRLSHDPSWWECKFCDYHQMCHSNEVPSVNCRTCAHSTPNVDGKNAEWACEKHSKELPIQFQRKGCDAHRFIPALLHWAEPVDANHQDNWMTYQLPTGGRFTNGAPPQGLSSAEIHACKDKQSLAVVSNEFASLREQFGARVVG
jgi:hypothetical protein